MPRKNAAAAAAPAADDTIRRPGITPSGLPGGDVNSPFIRGAPRTILIDALDFMRGHHAPHRARKNLPLVAVSSIFTSVGPYAIQRRRVSKKTFRLFAEQLSTFRFITHLNLYFVQGEDDEFFDSNEIENDEEGEEMYYSFDDDEPFDSDDDIDHDFKIADMGSCISKIDRVLHIALGRESYNKLWELDEMISCEMLPQLQYIDLGARGHLYKDYARSTQYDAEQAPRQRRQR